MTLGAKNPDLIARPPTPLDGLTLGDAVRLRWVVTSYCSQCKTRLHVATPALMQLLGEDYILWGRKPRCRVWVGWDLDRRCPGLVTFHAQASLKGSAVEMKWSREVDQAIEMRSQKEAYGR